MIVPGPAPSVQIKILGYTVLRMFSRSDINWSYLITNLR